ASGGGDGDAYTIYAITKPISSNGAITAPAGAFKGSAVTVTVTPATDFLLQGGSLKYGTTESSGTPFIGTFTMPGNATTIFATFLSTTSSGMAVASMNGLGYTTLSSAITAAQGTATEPAVITLLKDVSSSTISLSGKYVQLVSGKSGGVTISPSSGSSNPVFTVSTGSGLTLGSSAVSNPLTIDGKGYTSTAPLIKVDGGTFTMNGGTIGDNNNNNTSSSNLGSGVYMNGGTFTMNGGAISDNTASNSGGGVYMNGGIFTMSGGIISSNRTSSNGGGVYVNGGTFTMTGGTISSNRASTNGGGVYMNSGTFKMSLGGEIITGNNGIKGGGVYIASGGTFEMSGGIINTNQASDKGGGVSAAGKFTMSKGTISGNRADDGGGGVYNAGTNEFKMSGGAISSNTANYGGGVMADKRFTMSGNAEISGNQANFAGNGVYMDGSEGTLAQFNMSGGIISRNTGGLNGGGVVMIHGTFTMSGNAEISSNTTSDGGGGITLGVDGNCTMKDNATITGNTTGGDGGGVHVAGTLEIAATFHMSGGTISRNTAKWGGGVFVMQNSRFFISGGTVVGDNVAVTNQGPTIARAPWGTSKRGTPEIQGAFIGDEEQWLVIGGDLTTTSTP
ncbi:hypothetical protein LQZ19_06605, partial [Treponema primitia]